MEYLFRVLALFMTKMFFEKKSRMLLVFQLLTLAMQIHIHTCRTLVGIYIAEMYIRKHKNFSVIEQLLCTIKNQRLD